MTSPSTRRRLVLASTAAAALVAPLAVALPAQARNFRSSDVHPTDYPTVQAVRHFGKLLFAALWHGSVA